MDTSLFKITPLGRTGLLFALFSFVVVPSFVGGQWLSIFTSTACFTLAAAGVAFMYARLGMVSLTQVGLMGVGGWVFLRLNHGFSMPFEINMLLAGLVTMAFGMILTLPALRLRGLYLALITLMAAGGLEIVFATFQFPNGGEGFWGVQSSFASDVRRPFLAQSDANYLRYTIVVVTLGILLIELHRRLAAGRAWALIRRSEAAAMSAGVNVALYKTWAFGICGLLAGFAGAMLAGSLGLLDAGTHRASESIMIFALAVVGGANYWLGAVIAAGLFKIVPALLNDWGLDPDLSFVIFGAGLLHAVITAPNGIAGQLIGLAGKFNPQSVEKPQTKSAVSSDASVAIKDVSVHFGGVVALDKINVTFSKPISGIVGPNGAGKTTLMNVFSGFVDSEDGSIIALDKNLMRMTPHRRSQWGLRRSFQREEIANDLTVFENVMAQLDGMRGSQNWKKQETKRALEYVGMSDKVDIRAENLNSFDRRLTDIAKCLVGDPKIIMFDEPAGGLSTEETKILGDLILGVHEQSGAITLIIDHDIDLISSICEETLVLDFGKMIAFGETDAVLNDPKVQAAYLGVEEV